MKYKRDIVFAGYGGRQELRIPANERPLLNYVAHCPKCKSRIKYDLANMMMSSTQFFSFDSDSYSHFCKCGKSVTAEKKKAAHEQLATLEKSHPQLARRLLDYFRPLRPCQH